MMAVTRLPAALYFGGMRPVRIASSVCCADCCEGVRGLGRGGAGLAGRGIVDMRG